MFATLLDPALVSDTLEGRIAAVTTLGGPYMTDKTEELAAARAAGLQGALLVQDHDSADLVTEVTAATQSESEIIAIRTSALSVNASSLAAEIARLSSALKAAEGRHRMLICVDVPLAPISGIEWRELPVESLLIDPIKDPDAWRAAANLPGDRGLILALVSSAGGDTAAREVLLWALRYAASLGGRGGLRVGFTERPAPANVSGAQQERDSRATSTLNALADLLRLTAADSETLRRELDPRSFSPAATRRVKRT